MENDSRSAESCTPSITKSATLFQTLSTDTLSIIAKRLAFMYVDSTHHMANKLGPLCLLALLFSENSPFRCTAANIVSRIELMWSYSGTSFFPGSDRIAVGQELFEGEAKEMELGRSVFSACGPYVRRITVREVPKEVEKAKDFVERFKSYVFLYCRNVEEVAFCKYGAPLTKWGTATSFFREYAENLRVIEWHGDEDENSFSDMRKCSNVRRLTSRRLNTGTLVSLLKACGLTLEELDISIKPVGDSAEVMEAIQAYCGKLSVINIKNLKDVIERVGHESYSKLIRSYGSRLRKARTEELDHEHLLGVARACTNLEVSVRWSWMNSESVDWRRVYALGPRVLHLHFNGNVFYGDDYPRALEQCSNLRMLDISGIHVDGRAGVTEEMIANVFAPSRFPKLEKLLVTSFRANERNMRLISSCTANLNHAYLLPFGWDSKASTFQIIVDSNKHLNAIHVHIYSYHEPPQRAETALESLSALVKVFRKRRSLDLALCCSVEGEVREEDLIHVAKALPCRERRVHLQIGDVHYELGN